MIQHEEDTQSLKPERMRQIVKDDYMSRLLGICSGIIADGNIHPAELSFLQTWLTDNKSITHQWPASLIVQKIDQITSDGKITQEELDGLLIALQSITGITYLETGSSAPEATAIPEPNKKNADKRLIHASDLPPMPKTQIGFENKVFCFSGNFLFGQKKACQEATEKQGATISQDITKSVDFLIVGSVPSSKWKFGSYGRKIEAAANWHAEQGKPHILSEEDWTLALSKES